MNVRSNRVRQSLAGASLVLGGLIAGGTIAAMGTANADTTTTTSSSSAPTSADTPVSGTSADDVKAAVKAKFPTATITTVQKDPDGSFDALGTDASGNGVFYDVSADLKTITAGGGAGGHGGHGGHGGGMGGGQDTPASASEASSVKAAVKAKDSAVTITTVRKDPDGSFDALGTDASGNGVFYDVSADYKTVTANAGRPGTAASSSTTS